MHSMRPILPSRSHTKLKTTWDTEFDDEKRIYQKLAPLQGHAIPVFYGESTCHGGTRALLLSGRRRHLATRTTSRASQQVDPQEHDKTRDESDA